MTATRTTTPATDDDEPHTIDDEPDDSTGSRTPGRPVVTLELDAADAHHLTRVCEIGLVVLARDEPPSELAQRLLNELNAYQTGPVEAPEPGR